MKSDFYEQNHNANVGGNVVRPIEAVPVDAHVVEAPRRYYMGIIDILQQFDWSKRLEYYIKTGLLKKDWHTISCSEPKFYARRFLNFMDDIIAEDSQRSNLHDEKLVDL